MMITISVFSPLHSSAAEAEQPSVELKGLVVVKSQEAILKEGDPGLAVTGLQIKDVDLLEGKDFEKLIQPFFGRPIDGKLLPEIQVAIRNHYRKKGFPLVDPVFPPQTVTGGVLQLLVIESRLGKVIFEGTNRWSQTEYLRKNLRVTEGERINEHTLLSDLNWLNRNKFRSIDAMYKPGEGRFESDLLIRTSERFPMGASVGIDNTGNRLTGETRWNAGLEWGKAFGFTDHFLSYRYLSDLDLDFLQAHLASYTISLPWRHTLTLSGSYSEVKGDIPNTLASQEGTSYQMNLRYGIDLPTLRAYRHEATLGADFRRLDSLLEFNSQTVLEDAVEIAHASIGYSGLLPDHWGSTFLGGELYVSPGGLSDRNSDTTFELSYPARSIKSDYVYARINLERVTRLPARFSWRASGSYQMANGELLPSEQFGLGGVNTVRGYEERTSSGTEGLVIANEVRTPPFSLGKVLDKTARDEMQLLGFFDYGQTSNRVLLPGEDPHALLKSVGIGLRYRVSRFLSVRFDYGWQLKDPGLGFNMPNSRGHVSASFSF